MYRKLVVTLILSSLQLGAQEFVLYDKDKKSDITKVFDEVAALRQNPPAFFIDAENFLTYSGDGDFGVLYTKEKYQDFILDLRIRIPSGPFIYVNSGIFFRFKDPKDLNDNSIPLEIKKLAESRTPGFIADWSGYEVQLLAGVIAGDPLNKRNGAFYGQPIGSNDGQQEVNEFNFEEGQVYDVRLKVVGQKFEVYMKWHNENEYMLVSSFYNINLQKSFNAGHVGIQSYYSDNQKVKAFKFERISIRKL